MTHLSPPFTDLDASDVLGDSYRQGDARALLGQNPELAVRVWLDIGELTRVGWLRGGLDEQELILHSKGWIKGVAQQLQQAVDRMVGQELMTRQGGHCETFSIIYLAQLLRSDWIVTTDPRANAITLPSVGQDSLELARGLLKQLVIQMSTSSFELADLPRICREVCNKCKVDRFAMPGNLLRHVEPAKIKSQMPLLVAAVEACVGRNLRPVDELAVRLVCFAAGIARSVQAGQGEGVGDVQLRELLTAKVSALRHALSPNFDPTRWECLRSELIKESAFLQWLLPYYNKVSDRVIEQSDIHEEIFAGLCSQSKDPWVRLSGHMLQQGTQESRQVARSIARSETQGDLLNRRIHIQRWLASGDAKVWKKVLTKELIEWSTGNPSRMARAIVIGAAAVQGVGEISEELVEHQTVPSTFVETEFTAFLESSMPSCELDGRDPTAELMAIIWVLVGSNIGQRYERLWRCDEQGVPQATSATLVGMLANSYWEFRRRSMLIGAPCQWMTPFFQFAMIPGPTGAQLSSVLESLGLSEADRFAAPEILGLETSNTWKVLGLLLTAVRSHRYYQSEPIQFQKLFGHTDIKAQFGGAPRQLMDRVATALCWIICRSLSAEARKVKMGAKEWFLETQSKVIRAGILASFVIRKHSDGTKGLIKERVRIACRRMISDRPLGGDERALLSGSHQLFEDYAVAIENLSQVRPLDEWDPRLLARSKWLFLWGVLCLASLALLLIQVSNKQGSG